MRTTGIAPGSAGSPLWPLPIAATSALWKPVGQRSPLQGPSGKQRKLLPAGHWPRGQGGTCVQKEVSGAHPAPAPGSSQDGVLGLEGAAWVGDCEGPGFGWHCHPDRCCFPSLLPPPVPVCLSIRSGDQAPELLETPLLPPCPAPAPLGLRFIPWAVRDSHSTALRCDSSGGPSPLRGPWGGARLPGCRVCSPGQN